MHRGKKEFFGQKASTWHSVHHTAKPASSFKWAMQTQAKKRIQVMNSNADNSELANEWMCVLVLVMHTRKRESRAHQPHSRTVYSTTNASRQCVWGDSYIHWKMCRITWCSPQTMTSRHTHVLYICSQRIPQNHLVDVQDRNDSDLQKQKS